MNALLGINSINSPTYHVTILLQKFVQFLYMNTGFAIL